MTEILKYDWRNLLIKIEIHVYQRYITRDRSDSFRIYWSFTFNLINDLRTFSIIKFSC
jgi:hypothetical protein